jgi:hypothetical protein
VHALIASIGTLVLATTSPGGLPQQSALPLEPLIRHGQECQRLWEAYAQASLRRIEYLKTWIVYPGQAPPSTDELRSRRPVLQWLDGAERDTRRHYEFICERGGWVVE